MIKRRFKFLLAVSVFAFMFAGSARLYIYSPRLFLTRGIFHRWRGARKEVAIRPRC